MNSNNFLWTNHARMKLAYYRLTESRIKRIVRHPVRVEEGILEGAVAAMSPATGKRYSEIWCMYVLIRGKDQSTGVKIITAWRYPGKAPERNPVPLEILHEIKNLF